MERADYLEEAKKIHQANIDAGWWKQEHEFQNATGPLITQPRNIGELLCLVHSEIDELWEGFIYNSPDDHLPHYPSVYVELADIQIRTLDLLGYYNSKLKFLELPNPYDMPDSMKLTFAECCLSLHALTTSAMEAFRKGNEAKGIMKLWHLLDCTYYIANRPFSQFNLDEIREAKLAYNRNRADHKPENRAKPGGKAF